MDLRELRDLNKNRHPWEISRVRAVRFLLRKIMYGRLKLLDVGCGDGYVARELYRENAEAKITAVDTNLTEDRIAELSRLGDGIEYLNRYPAAGRVGYDLILLMDVIEHVADDRAFLREITERRLAEGGRMLITVPAFQFLFGPHDRFLGHYRRYSLRGLQELADRAGLRCSSSGYMFSALLLPRLLSSSLQRFLEKGRAQSEGVGNWRHGKTLTKMIELFLRVDNRVSFAMNSLGIKIPGLTVWVLCEKPR